MIGAIIGDVVGSRFEFHNTKTKDFALVTSDSVFTDDTVLTIALMDWILHSEVKDEESAAKYLQRWGRKYINAGYGTRFIRWLFMDNPQPYNSCGNGSAMRISGVAYASKDDDLIIKATICTHNHPEGIKGALVVANCIKMALAKENKEKIKEYCIAQYPEIASLDYEELRRSYFHGAETCQASVPQALYCFLISHDFEDCLRTTISIGGDCDTTAAMSCAIAEAYYQNIPSSLLEDVRKTLPKDMLDIIDEFKSVYGGY